MGKGCKTITTGLLIVIHFVTAEKAKSVSDFNKEIGAQELNISLGQINLNEVKLTEFILAMINVRPEHRKDRLNDKLLK